MRKNNAKCVTVHCMVLMIARYDQAYARDKTQAAKIQLVRRMMKRRRLSVRRVTHRGKLLRDKMHEIGAEVGARVRYKLEESGLLARCGYTDKAAHMYNMDQTGVYIDMNPSRTIDFVGAHDVDVTQAMSANSFRASVFLCASAYGHKLPPMIVFAGTQNARVHQEVLDLEDGVMCTVQKKAFTDERVMTDWITQVWQADIDECRHLLVDSLKVHKMDLVRQLLEDSNTEVEFIPPGLTGICQPMDVSVMKLFKDNLRTLFHAHHIENPFSDNAADRRKLIAKLVKQAWDQVPSQAIANGFVKCRLLPIGPRNALGRFPMEPLPEDVDGEEQEGSDGEGDDVEEDVGESSSEDEDHVYEAAKIVKEAVV